MAKSTFCLSFNTKIAVTKKNIPPSTSTKQVAKRAYCRALNSITSVEFELIIDTAVETLKLLVSILEGELLKALLNSSESCKNKHMIKYESFLAYDKVRLYYRLVKNSLRFFCTNVNRNFYLKKLFCFIVILISFDFF